MEIIFDIRGNVLITELSGELDHHAASGVREKIDDKIDIHGVRNILFDFSNVTFMDSSGIGMILGRYKKLSEYGGHVAISGCSLNIRNILNMAGVFSVIDYMDTKEEAANFLENIRKDVY